MSRKAAAGTGEGSRQAELTGPGVLSRAGICWFCSQLYLQGLDTVGAQYLLVERLLKMSDGGMMGDVISPSTGGRWCVSVCVLAYMFACMCIS